MQGTAREGSSSATKSPKSKAPLLDLSQIWSIIGIFDLKSLCHGILPGRTSLSADAFLLASV